MAATTEQHAVQTTFHLQVTPEQTLVLPDELLRQLQVAVGDVLAVSVSSGHGWVSKAPPAKLVHPVETEPVPDIEGMLSDYFTDHEDVMRFVEEERGSRPDWPSAQ